MSIPSQRVVADELLLLLHNSPGGRLHCTKIYDLLAAKYPELTHEELEIPYQNSQSKWANTVQYSRLYCVSKNFIYKAKDPRSGGVGFWSITEEGRRYVRECLQNTFIAELEESINVDPNKIYLEGSTKQTRVNAYERNIEARRACLSVHGTDCSVCGMNFGSVYGKVGAGFIHVHHLKPLAEIREEYELNPIEDLRPVCPNCHAVIHLRKPAYTIEEVKKLLHKISQP